MVDPARCAARDRSRPRECRMPTGIPGTTAWVLVMTVANPVPSPVQHLEPSVEFKTEAECRNVAGAINGKAHEAGVQEQLKASCGKIVYMELPEN